MRINAGLGMARITQLVDEIAHQYEPNAVGAIGQCDIYPNSRNIIPGKAIFTVDFRHPEKSIISSMERDLRMGAKKNSRRHRFRLRNRVSWWFRPRYIRPGLRCDSKSGSRKVRI
jgi:acetylornithine deacetylase/succinyl-diaminopimelate desuccinylase-like protein